jgi:hypothetical protein
MKFPRTATISISAESVAEIANALNNLKVGRGETFTIDYSCVSSVLFSDVFATHFHAVPVFSTDDFFRSIPRCFLRCLLAWFTCGNNGNWACWLAVVGIVCTQDYYAEYAFTEGLNRLAPYFKSFFDLVKIGIARFCSLFSRGSNGVEQNAVPGDGAIGSDTSAA